MRETKKSSKDGKAGELEIESGKSTKEGELENVGNWPKKRIRLADFDLKILPIGNLAIGLSWFSLYWSRCQSLLAAAVNGMWSCGLLWDQLCWKGLIICSFL